MTATSVLSGSNVARDLLRSLGCRMRHLPAVLPRQGRMLCRGPHSIYKRHGTTTLFAALNVLVRAGAEQTTSKTKQAALRESERRSIPMALFGAYFRHSPGDGASANQFPGVPSRTESVTRVPEHLSAPPRRLKRWLSRSSSSRLGYPGVYSGRDYEGQYQPLPSRSCQSWQERRHHLSPYRSDCLSGLD